MKRITYVIAALVCFAFASQAQTPHLLPASSGLIQHDAGQQFKTNSTKYRITGGKSDYYSGGVWEPTDSVTLSYTGTRGEGLDLYFYNALNSFPNLEFDAENYYNFDGTIWVKAYKYIQEFDASDLPESNTYSEWDGAVFNDVSRNLYTHNADKTIASDETEYYTGGVWENYEITEYNYDGGSLSYTVNKNWSGAVYENSYKDFYVRDITTGVITSLTDQQWDGADWVNNYRWLISYNELNQIIQEIYQYWDGLSWVESYKYTYEYDENDQLYVSTNYYTGDITSRNVYTYDGAYDLDQILNQSYSLVDGYVNVSRQTLDYMGTNPSYIYTESWDGSTYNPVSRVYYYSESFDDGVVSIDNTVKNNISCSVFPQPAHAEVNFEVKGMQASEMDITITDITGKIITIKHVNSLNGVVTLSGDEIPQAAGIYTWSLATAEGMHSNGKLIIN